MGTIQKQGIQNTIVTYVGIAIGFLNLMVLQPYVLTPEEIGLTRVLYNFSSLVAVFLPLGVTNITIKYFPQFRNNEKKHHGFFGFMLLFPALGFVLTSTILFFLRDFFISQYIKESKLFTEYFDYVIPLSFLIGLISIINCYAFALFKTTFPSILNDIIVRIFTMIVISIYYLKWITLNQFVFLFVVSFAVQLVILIYYIYLIDRPGWKPNMEFIKKKGTREIFSYGFILSLVSFTALGIKYIDSIMIGKYMPLANVGIYTIAAFIPTIIEAPLVALEKISSNKIAHSLANKNIEEVKTIYYTSCKYLLLLGGLFFVGINVNIHTLLTFLPSAYSGGEPVVLIISIGTLCNMALGSNGAIIFSSDKYKFGAFLLALIAVVALAANMVLIPKYGLIGAASATAFSTFLYVIARYIFIFIKFRLQPFDIKTLQIIGIVLLSFGFNFLIPAIQNPMIDIIIRSIIVTLIFSIATISLRIVPEFHKHIPFLKHSK